MTRDEVFQEFTRWTGWPNTTRTIHQTHWYDTDAMADDIVRLRDRLAAVEAERDALAAVVEVVRKYYQRKADDDQLYQAFCTWRTAISTVSAAKQEASHA